MGSTQRKLVVHIGTPKTGSTSIQYMLHRLAVALELRGTHVPVAGRSSDYSHCNLALPAGHWATNPSLGGWADLAREVECCSAPRCVISCENFTSPWARGEPNIDRLLALARAADREIQVIGYVRPQYQRLEAGYNQQVLMGGMLAPFDTFVAERLAESQLDYGALFRPWREAFGDRLTVYPLERARMPAGLLAHFLGVLGARDLAGAAAALPRRNERLGAKHLEVLRLTAVALDHQVIDYPVTVQLLRPVLFDLPALLDGDAPFAGLNPAQIEALTARFAASNARFAREHGIDAGGVLFREQPADTSARPRRAEWRDFAAEERRRVRRFVRAAAGVDLPTGAGPRRWRRFQSAEPAAAAVRGQDWRRVAVPPASAFNAEQPVSVVVSGPAAAEELAGTLAALERQDYPRALIEVVIVDSGPRPAGTKSGAAQLNVKAVDSAPGGSGPDAWNAGARAATHDLLVFLDGGLMPAAGWLAAHARWHQVVTDVVTVAECIVASVHDGARERRRTRLETPSALPVDRPGRALARAPFGISRRFLELVGGFDASVAGRAAQAAELGDRVCTHGGLLAPVEEAICFRPKPEQGLAEPDRPARPACTVTITGAAGHGREAGETAAAVLAGAGAETVVRLDVPVESGEVEAVRLRLPARARSRFEGGAAAPDELSATPVHVRIPAGAKAAGYLVGRLAAGLGGAVAGAATLTDGTAVSIARSWALHRVRRTGRPAADFGDVADLDAAIGLPRPVLAWRAVSRRIAPAGALAGRVRERTARIGRGGRAALAHVRSLRGPGDVPAFLRWLRWEIEGRCRRKLRIRAGIGR